MGKSRKTKTRPQKKAAACPKPNSWRGRLTRFGARMDVIGHLAQRIEPNFKTWWVPVTLLAFPLLLLFLAALITNLRPG